MLSFLRTTASKFPKVATGATSGPSRTNVGQALQKAMRGIEKANPETLYGIFGDAHGPTRIACPMPCSATSLSTSRGSSSANQAAQADILGQSYEYLIKKFADLTNKKAGEFYTPRSVVRLMVNILDPKEGESIYDPACGTGGMLLEAIHHVRENHGDDRTLWGKLFGQEKNLTTSAIARMNLFLHGARISRSSAATHLRHPAFFSGDNLATFDCVIANPPFSLEKWGDEVWAKRPLWPQLRRNAARQNRRLRLGAAHDQVHGARDRPYGGGPAARRALPNGQGRHDPQKLLEMDLLEAVIGLGPNLFYGTGLAACILVFRQRKKKDRRTRCSSSTPRRSSRPAAHRTSSFPSTSNASTVGIAITRMWKASPESSRSMRSPPTTTT